MCTCERGGAWFLLHPCQFWGVALSRADLRKLKREKVQNPTSAKIATLEIFQLYGIIIIYIILLSKKVMFIVSCHNSGIGEEM